MGVGVGAGIGVGVGAGVGVGVGVGVGAGDGAQDASIRDNTITQLITNHKLFLFISVSSLSLLNSWV